MKKTAAFFLVLMLVLSFPLGVFAAAPAAPESAVCSEGHEHELEMAPDYWPCGAGPGIHMTSWYPGYIFLYGNGVEIGYNFYKGCNYCGAIEYQYTVLY